MKVARFMKICNILFFPPILMSSEYSVRIMSEYSIGEDSLKIIFIKRVETEAAP